MHAAKIAISIDPALLERLDYFVKNEIFKSRSEAIQIAIDYQLLRLEHERLARACEALARSEEQSLADEGLDQDVDEWPEF